MNHMQFHQPTKSLSIKIRLLAIIDQIFKSFTIEKVFLYLLESLWEFLPFSVLGARFLKREKL